MKKAYEVDVSRVCPLCGEPLGALRWGSEAPEITLQGEDRHVEVAGRVELCPFCCLLLLDPGLSLDPGPDRGTRESEAEEGGVDGGGRTPVDGGLEEGSGPEATPHPDRCPCCAGALEGVALEPRAWRTSLEETTAILHINAPKEGRFCPGCRLLVLPGARMELKGLEVALQRDEVRRAFGTGLKRGCLVGMVLGVVGVALVLPWQGIGALASRAFGGALLGGAAGSVLASLGSLGWSLLRGGGRERLS